MIETKGLRKSFRSRAGRETRTVEAVRGVDLSVAKGEIFGGLTRGCDVSPPGGCPQKFVKKAASTAKKTASQVTRNRMNAMRQE